jgi:hypothetical protein
MRSRAVKLPGPSASAVACLMQRARGLGETRRIVRLLLDATEHRVGALLEADAGDGGKTDARLLDRRRHFATPAPRFFVAGTDAETVGVRHAFGVVAVDLTVAVVVDAVVADLDAGRIFTADRIAAVDGFRSRRSCRS